MSAFDWQHPSLKLGYTDEEIAKLRAIRRLDVPRFVRPAFWTSERYGIFLLICSLIIAVLLGYWWGGSA